ncbi:MAG: hypothetical protein Wins2KO_17640 [Winogradskyella sp.]
MILNNLDENSWKLDNMNAVTENIDEIHKMSSEPSKYGKNIGKKLRNIGEM